MVRSNSISESIWVWSGSKVEAFFRFTLMHLNSIVPVDIRRLRGLESIFRDSWSALNQHGLGGYAADFLWGQKKTIDHTVGSQVAQENLSKLYSTARSELSGTRCYVPVFKMSKCLRVV